MSKVKDTFGMLITIDNLNKSNTLTSDCRLVSFLLVVITLGSEELKVFLTLG